MNVYRRVVLYLPIEIVPYKNTYRRDLAYCVHMPMDRAN